MPKTVESPNQWAVDNETTIKLDGKPYTQFQITANALEDVQRIRLNTTHFEAPANLSV